MITYIKGDATTPIETPGRDRFLVHACNDIGLFAAGFAKALAERYPKARRDYLREKNNLALGSIIWSFAGRGGPYIGNMICMHGVRTSFNRNPLSYFYLRVCLKEVQKYALENNATVHMPRIGAGLAGGDWSKIVKIIEEELDACDVYIYEL